MPQYEIAELPEGFVESRRGEFPELTGIIYENEAGDCCPVPGRRNKHGGFGRGGKGRFPQGEKAHPCHIVEIICQAGGAHGLLRYQREL